MLTLTEEARRRLMLIVMNDAREAVDTSAPEVAELLGQGCLEVVHAQLDPYPNTDSHRWVAVTDLGREALAALSPRS